MILKTLSILNFKNIRETDLRFSDKINCFVGLNGQGKTNLLDAIYYLSFTKSAFNAIDSQNITHEQDFAMIQGEYAVEGGEPLAISCGLYRGRKKQFRRGKKDYKRLIEHIGLIPLVMVSPDDQELIQEGSEARRKFLDGVISQYNRPYLEHLTEYNALLKQRNSLLKQYEDHPESLPDDLMEVLEMQMTQHAEFIFAERTTFVDQFIPLFQSIYTDISNGAEAVSLRYVSQLQDRQLLEAYARTRQRDLILGWTSQGIHKDDIEMMLGEHPIKQVGSQGQQKTYLLAMKLAQALFLGQQTNNAAGPSTNGIPILLLDDIFDKLDNERVERIVRLVQSEQFGQIFITDTDRQHLTDILRPSADASIFHVIRGEVQKDERTPESPQHRG